jgi:chitin synthase
MLLVSVWCILHVEYTRPRPLAYSHREHSIVCHFQSLMRISQSFIPYVLLSPTYFNVLNVYAFANLDDISWGTKGDTAVSNDLGSVKQNIHQQVSVEVYAGPAGANEVYEDALENLRARKFDTRPKQAAPVRTTAEKELAAID